MSERVTMPALGESVTEGTVTRWLKNVGDQVEVDEPLLEVSTDKVDTEIPSPVAGTLQEILAQEDDTVPVGADLAVIGDGDAPAAQPSAPEAEPEQAAEPGRRLAAPAPEAPSTEQEPQPATSEPEAEQAQQPQPASSGSEGGGGQTVTMPALGESVTEGTVTRWLKAEGDDVAVDEPLLEVSTDKVDTEIPSPVAGTLTKILVQEDETVPVGGDLAVIGGERVPPASAEAEQPRPSRKAEAPKAEEPKAEAPQARRSRRRRQAPARRPKPAQEAKAAEPAGQPADAPRPPAQQSPEAPEPVQPAASGEAPASGVRRRRRRLRHPARAQARHPARRRPRLGHGHRRRRPHPQAGCARCRRGGQGRRAPSPAAPAAAAGGRQCAGPVGARCRCADRRLARSAAPARR